MMTSFVPSLLCVMWVTFTSITSQRDVTVGEHLLLPWSVGSGRCYRRTYNIHANLSAQFCWKPYLNEEQSHEVMKLYPGLFTSQRESPLQEEFHSVNEKRGDGDVCCPTLKWMEIPWKLRNVLGRTKRIVHLPIIELYQFVQWGKCLHSKCMSGEGMCMVDTTIRYLLVWDRKSIFKFWPFTFDAFEIPTCCSCKNV